MGGFFSRPNPLKCSEENVRRCLQVNKIIYVGIDKSPSNNPFVPS